jgi:hypothetical protein
MALSQINAPIRRPEKESIMDKILKGVQITQGLLGAGLAIPKWLDQKEQAEKTYELDKGREQTAFDKSFIEAPTIPASPGLAGEANPTGSFSKDVEKPYEPKKLPFGAVSVDRHEIDRVGNYMPRPKTESGLSPFDSERLKDIYRDFVPAEQDEAGAFAFTIGNNRIWVKDKPGEDGTTRIDTRTDKLRQEYLKQSNTFESQTDSYARLVAAGTDPSAAGDLALIFNYMKILDPGSVVRESEFANAAATGSLPQRAQAAVAKVLRGERLSIEQRKDFMDRGKKLYDAARKRHSGRVDFYTTLAEEERLNPRRIIVPVDVNPIDRDAFMQEMNKLSEAFRGIVPKESNEPDPGVL